MTDEKFADVPWWARPSYVKAMGMAIIAVVTGFLLALYQFGLLGGGGDEEPSTDETEIEDLEDPEDFNDDMPEDELPPEDEGH